jgi:hypothetical protein
MSDRETAYHYASQGPLGQVVSKGALLIGTYNMSEEAMESIVWRERLKSPMVIVGPF